MTSPDIHYMRELAAHDADIESLNATAFGPARYTRAASLVRRGGPHELLLSFVAIAQEHIIGSVRVTPVAIGCAKALLLGPIVVSPGYKNAGVGSVLMNMTLDAAQKAGHGLVILVGDEAYYRRFCFRRVAAGKIIMPAPLDPARLLARELSHGALQAANGIVRHINCTRR